MKLYKNVNTGASLLSREQKDYRKKKDIKECFLKKNVKLHHKAKIYKIISFEISVIET